jgi:hypothetical protein
MSIVLNGKVIVPYSNQTSLEVIEYSNVLGQGSLPPSSVSGPVASVGLLPYSITQSAAMADYLDPIRTEGVTISN